MATDDFAVHCCELLSAAGPCAARRMFGGWGISTGGLNIGIVVRDVLYLKVEKGQEARWTQAGGRPFTYEREGRPMNLGYYTAPDSAMESPGLMAPWARLALDAALKARKPARPSKPSPRRLKAPAPKASARRRSAKG